MVSFEMQGVEHLFKRHANFIHAFFTVAKYQILDTIAKWGSVFNVEADITVIKLPDQPKRIFHFTQKGKMNKIPEVLLLNDGKIHICSGKVFGSPNEHFCKYFNSDLNKKYHLKIRQFKQNEKTIYNIMFNGEMMYSGENKQPEDFDNVKVYVSDKSKDPFTSGYGLLENLQYDKIRKYQAPG